MGLSFNTSRYKTFSKFHKNTQIPNTLSKQKQVKIKTVLFYFELVFLPYGKKQNFINSLGFTAASKTVFVHVSTYAVRYKCKSDSYKPFTYRRSRDPIIILDGFKKSFHPFGSRPCEKGNENLLNSRNANDSLFPWWRGDEVPFAHVDTHNR